MPRDFDRRSYSDERPAIVRIDPITVLQHVQDHWIAGQLRYHQRTAQTLRGVAHFTESLARYFNCIVIVIVAFDISILLASFFHFSLWGTIDRWHAYTPWLVFLAAVLPAMVASLNGIRFQSECERLANRSAVMVRMLKSHAAEANGADANCAIAPND
ncbi:MAG: hypothetical protein O3C60_13995 [Planctomycetota bacterium]|nr:hypothetical protein [Planctomycetota bacterium]